MRRAEIARAVAREIFETRLHAAIDRQANERLRRRTGKSRLGGVGGESRKSLAAVGHVLGFGELGLGRFDHALPRQPVDDTVAGAAGGRRIAVRAAGLGRLRQRNEERCLRRREARRLLAEIGERGGADAFQIAAIGREREIEIEDGGLADLALERGRGADLPDLAREIAAAFGFEQARRLHRERRTARHHVSVRDGLPGRTREGDGIGAEMRVEPAVLIGLEECEKLGIDLGGFHRQTPDTFRRRERPQQMPVAVDDKDRHRAGPLQRRRRREGEPERRGSDGESRGGCGYAEETAQLHFHFGSVTSIAPASGAGKAVDTVHVLDRRRRLDVFTRRDRAGDIGRDHPVVRDFGAVEDADIAVVAELRIVRRKVLVEPGQVLQFRAGDDARIVDLETGRKTVDDEKTADLLVGLRQPKASRRDACSARPSRDRPLRRRACNICARW